MLHLRLIAHGVRGRAANLRLWLVNLPCLQDWRIERVGG